MAAPKQSKIVLGGAQAKCIFEDLQGKVASTTSFNTGDLLCWDATNHIVYLATAEGNGSTFLGMSDVSVTSGHLLSPYQGTDVDASQPSYEILGPKYSCQVLCVLKTGDSLNIGDSVYLDVATGTRGVTASGTKAIGIYAGRAAVSSAAAGTEIIVLLGARFPNDSLKF